MLGSCRLLMRSTFSEWVDLRSAVGLHDRKMCSVD
jgi:hypothetical protein